MSMLSVWRTLDTTHASVIQGSQVPAVMKVLKIVQTSRLCLHIVYYILYSLSLFAAVECGMVKNPKQGFIQCNHVYGEFRFNSSCYFHCARGYILKGSKHIHCLSLGKWDSESPECQGREWHTVFILLISLLISIALMICSCFITCFFFHYSC